MWCALKRLQLAYAQLGARLFLVPIASDEAAEGDQSDQRDHDSEPQAPNDRDDDPNDDEDPAEADSSDDAAAPTSINSHLRSFRYFLTWQTVTRPSRTRVRDPRANLRPRTRRREGHSRPRSTQAQNRRHSRCPRRGRFAPAPRFGASTAGAPRSRGRSWFPYRSSSS